MSDQKEEQSSPEDKEKNAPESPEEPVVQRKESSTPLRESVKDKKWYSEE